MDDEYLNGGLSTIIFQIIKTRMDKYVHLIFFIQFIFEICEAN